MKRRDLDRKILELLSREPLPAERVYPELQKLPKPDVRYEDLPLTARLVGEALRRLHKARKITREGDAWRASNPQEHANADALFERYRKRGDVVRALDYVDTEDGS